MRYRLVILAAGRNERLKGIVPLYHKPLILVNGRPNFLNQIYLAVNHGEIGPKPAAVFKCITVVAAPENVVHIRDIIQLDPIVGRLFNEDLIDIVVQSNPRGPGHAIQLALGHSNHGIAERTIVLCADNIIDQATFDGFVIQDRNVMLHAEKDRPCSTINERMLTLSVRAVDTWEQAKRFTRWADDQFVEGQSLITPATTSDGKYVCWIGPFAAHTNTLHQQMTKHIHQLLKASSEVKISPVFNLILNGDIRLLNLYETQLITDIGIPQEVVNHDDKR